MNAAGAGQTNQPDRLRRRFAFESALGAGAAHLGFSEPEAPFGQDTKLGLLPQCYLGFDFATFSLACAHKKTPESGSFPGQVEQGGFTSGRRREPVENRTRTGWNTRCHVSAPKQTTLSKSREHGRRETGSATADAQRVFIRVS